MPTPNLNLPLIDPSMSADVPRDMNALARAVDEAVGPQGSIALKTDVQAVSRSLDEHIRDNTKHITQAERDMFRKASIDIGDVTQLATQNKTLVTAVNEVFTDIDNGLTGVANAVTDKGVFTPPDAGFATIIQNIAMINTGLKYAKGTKTISNEVYLTVRGLPFRPAVIITKGVNRAFCHSMHVAGDFFGLNQGELFSYFRDHNSGNSNLFYTGQVEIYNDGFKVRVLNISEASPIEFSWAAIE